MKMLDAVIVGAGPAGSAAAMGLAQRGFRVALVDRARFPRDKPCGDYCDPGAERILHDIGCLDDVLAAGASPISTMTVAAQDGNGFTAAFPSGRGLLIPRRRLDAVLRNRAEQAGAQILEGFRADGVRIEHDGANVVEARPGTRAIAARLIIAADGMRSIVARRLGLLTVRPVGRFTVGAYFSGLPGPAPQGALHLGPRLYGGVAHFGDGTANVCLALPRTFFHERTPAAAFAEGVRHLPVLADLLTSARRESAFRCTGPVGFASHRVVADRVILAGDAAGQIEPMTGQGIFFALRAGTLAAEAAADALTAGDLSARRLHGYARRRAQEVAGKLWVSRVVGSLALRPRLTPRLVRRLASRPALAGRLLGATGDVLSPDAVLSTDFLVRLLVGLDAHTS